MSFTDQFLFLLPKNHICYFNDGDKFIHSLSFPVHCKAIFLLSISFTASLKWNDTISIQAMVYVMLPIFSFFRLHIQLPIINHSVHSFAKFCGTWCWCPKRCSVLYSINVMYSYQLRMSKETTFDECKRKKSRFVSNCCKQWKQVDVWKVHQMQTQLTVWSHLFRPAC